MKKILLSTIAIFSLSVSFSQLGQLYNNSFNMWGTDVIASEPTDWLTSYSAFGVSNPSQLNVEPSTDATHLSKSVKLTSTPNGATDVAFGFVLLGSLGNNGPEGGIPFTVAADSIVFDAKFDIQDGDSSNVYVIMKNSGIPFYMGILRFGGVSNGWERMSFPINELNLTPDSLILGFTSSETQNGGEAVGTWVMIDNVRFIDGSTESSTIPNPSFENWDDITAEGCNEWWTLNKFYAAFDFATAHKSTDAQEGTYAMELIPDSLIANGETNFVPGLAVYGSMDIYSGQFTGKPFTATATTMTGYYKWAPVNGATGNISVILRENGADIGGGSFDFTSAQNSYTQFTMPLVYSGTPDSIIVVINGGDIGGSALLVDNIQFTGGSVGTKEITLTDPTVSVYPNPTVADASIKIGLPKSAAVNYTVTNALGQQIVSDNLGTMKEGTHTIRLNSSEYPTGLYFVKVRIGETVTTQKLIVK